MRRFLGKRAATAALAFGLAIAAGLVVAPAPAAAVPGMQFVQASSPTDATTMKSMVAPCPTGMDTLDGGASITGGNGQVRITSLRPLGSFGFEAVASVAMAGGAGQWRLNVFAICVPYEVGLTYQVETVPYSTQWWRSHAVQCPRGKHLVGSGGHLMRRGGYPHTGLALHLLYPSPDLSQLTVQAYRVDAGYTEPWAMQVYAICADRLPGLVRVVGSPAPEGLASVVSCPAGTRVHGVAGGINAAPTQAALVRHAPSANLQGVAVEGVTTGGQPPPWQSLAIAICAN